MELNRSNPIFVIGTGRSGTHWVGYILADHPDIRATIEIQPMFGWVTKMATAPAAEKRLFRWLVWAYRLQILKSRPRRYLDKSHPNLWLAERLAKAFPQAAFVGIERSPFATVASMIKHTGVADWHRRWRDLPVPNRFLGLEESLVPTYESLPLATKCALRWRSHHEEMTRLRPVLGDRLLVLDYEALILDNEVNLERLREFLQLDRAIPRPEIRRGSLDKWRDQLSPEEIGQISEVAGFGPPED